jgi:nuclear transport factor 2 (NTF2) superfamily protein
MWPGAAPGSRPIAPRWWTGCAARWPEYQAAVQAAPGSAMMGVESICAEVFMDTKPPLPPFTAETAAQKARMAEDAWNTRDPDRVVQVYTPDTVWRNRAEFPVGREQVRQFLQRKWAKELDYRLIKEVWAFAGNRIAVRFAYEWHDDSGHWYRSYGNENWEFNDQGFMQRRFASINDLPIQASDRQFHWPLGRRPDDHPSLSDLGL